MQNLQNVNTMANLKSRILKLEEAKGIEEVDGILIYFENEIREEIDGISQMVKADCYLNKDGEGEPMTLEDAQTIDKLYISFIPIEDKLSEVEYLIVT